MTHWLFKLEVVTYVSDSAGEQYFPAVYYYGDKASAKARLRKLVEVRIGGEATVNRGPRHHKGETGITMLQMGAGHQPPDWFVPESCPEEGDVVEPHWPAGLTGIAAVHESCDSCKRLQKRSRS